eukprot:jgi/Ulvmu1/8727/UM047_0068.1
MRTGAELLCHAMHQAASLSNYRYTDVCPDVTGPCGAHVACVHDMLNIHTLCFEQQPAVQGRLCMHADLPYTGGCRSMARQLCPNNAMQALRARRIQQWSCTEC